MAWGRQSGEPFGYTNRKKRREVYFLWAEACELIKIGVSNNAVKRIHELRGSSPDWLTLLGVMPCQNYGMLEAELHTKFADLRCHGEWFRPAPDLLEFIRLNAIPVPGVNEQMNPEKGDWEAARADMFDQKRAAFELLTW